MREIKCNHAKFFKQEHDHAQPFKISRRKLILKKTRFRFIQIKELICAMALNGKVVVITGSNCGEY